jgi:hypothetical protein
LNIITDATHKGSGGIDLSSFPGPLSTGCHERA